MRTGVWRPGRTRRSSASPGPTWSCARRRASSLPGSSSGSLGMRGAALAWTGTPLWTATATLIARGAKRTVGRDGEGALNGERVEGRLAAILGADVAGYSRLMGVDEEGTLSRLTVLRAALIDPAVAAHKGRI